MIELHHNEDCIRRFEAAWQKGRQPAIVEFLNSASRSKTTRPELLPLLQELICIDLEYRWQQRSGAHPKTIEQYVAEFPVLERPSVELIAEEYRVRHRWGDRPTHADYLQRFNVDRSRLREALQGVDDELKRETDRNPAAIAVNVPQNLDGADPAAPLRFSDYLLQKQIGAGGTGKVYRAQQKSLDRTVVVKYLRKSFARNQRAVARFVNEARTAARLNHRGIVTLHGLGRTPGGGYFIVMDHAVNGDLQRQIDLGKVTVEQSVAWAIEICGAMQYAHDHGIVHCDLKPSNLLLDSEFNACVSDFGFARSLLAESTGFGGMAGTAPYMAPEQIDDCWGPVSERTDIYGLGGVLYALLTGRPPHSGDRVSDVLARVVTAQPVQSVHKLNSKVPAQLSEICDSCLAKDATQRFATPHELRMALLDLG